MEGIIFLIALIPIALLILSVTLLNRVSALSRDVGRVREQLERLSNGKPSATMEEAAPAVNRAPVPPLVEEVLPPEPPPAPIVVEEKEEPVTVQDDAMDRMRALFPEEPNVPEERIVVESPQEPPVPLPPSKGFFERHPDLEKFIGENLINKIGIAVLVIGLGLLLRYAIGQNLISETGRTLIGIGAGGLLVFFAHRLRESFRAFSSVLVAGGIAVFYTTVAIAFHQYQLIGQTAAFIVMLVITGLAVALTLAYDRRELAVIALLGGFAAPFLASSGDGNYKVLFTYLLILDAGMLVLANYKKWYVINMLSFALTMLIVAAWAMDMYTGLEPRPSLIAFGFVTAFFLVFFAMNLLYNLKHRQTFAAVDHVLLLLNTAAYYGLGLHFLSDLETRIIGLFTVLIGLFYLVFAAWFHKREGIPSALKLLLIGLVLTFISLAAPVQLEGSHITLFWAAEAVLLLWFSQRTHLKLVERGSMIVLLLMGGSLFIDLVNVYGAYDTSMMRPLLNKGWITGCVAVLSFLGTWWLLRGVDREERMALGIARRSWGALALVLGLVATYVVNMLELRVILLRSFHPAVVAMAVMGWSLLYLVLVEWLMRRETGRVRGVLFALMGLAGLVFITAHYSNSRASLWLLLNGSEGAGFGLFHILATVLMVVVIVRIGMLARQLLSRTTNTWNIYLWSMAVFIVIFASQELDHVMMLAQRSTDVLSSARRVGYPILWGIGSFVFMWYGMRQRLRMIRVIALCLFGVILVKLFLFDLGALSEGGRVAAFIFLGVLLLVISFMYQKLKGLFMDDAPHPTTENDAPRS
jgi:uncharacterized membrane protein